MNRRSFVLALLAPLGLIALAPDVSADPKKETGSLNANQIADRMQAFYNKTRTFKAGFKQKYTIKAYAKVKESDGSVVFAKPGKMSWKYKNGNRVVSDGKLVKVYEAENKQMYEQSVDKSEYPAALAFLQGDGDLKKSFTLTRLNEKKFKFENGWVIEGVPREATPAYQKVIFYVDIATAQARRVILLDAQGNKNRFDFVNPVANVKPAADEFAFTAPPGTQVIKP